jgi:glycosyltransferase involved in cell wall biosynthesis
MVLLYVGSEEDRKNLITTLGAIKNINPNDYIFIKIGKAIINSNRNKHKEYISLNNINAIFIDNIESNQELANWYSISDIYLFPTLFE